MSGTGCSQSARTPLSSWLLTSRVTPRGPSKVAVPSWLEGVNSPLSSLVTPQWVMTRYEKPHGEREQALGVGCQRPVAGLTAVPVTVVVVMTVTVVVVAVLRVPGGQGARRGGKGRDGTGQRDAGTGEGGLFGEFPAREGHHVLLGQLDGLLARPHSRLRTNTS